MDAKQITIAVAGTAGKKEFKDVTILPSTQPRDVLNKLQLHGFQLVNGSGAAFADKDDLFAAVADGQKVYATKSDVEAGRGVGQL